MIWEPELDGVGEGTVDVGWFEIGASVGKGCGSDPDGYAS